MMEYLKNLWQIIVKAHKEYYNLKEGK